MELTTSYQLISSFGLTYGAIRTYGKYSSQSSVDNTTTYQLKQVYYCSQSGGYVGFDNGRGVLDGTEKTYGSYTRMYYGETVIQELTRVITHNQDGTSPTKNVETSWTASFGGNGSTSVNITFPTIARYPVLTNAPDFNDEQNATITFTNILGIPNATVRTILYDPSTGLAIPNFSWKDVNVASGTYTYNFTSQERQGLRTYCNNRNSKSIGFHLLTEANGQQYWSTPMIKTLTIINNKPTFSVSYQDTNATTIAITGDNQQIIQNHSTLQINITNATALKEATLSNVKVTINGITTTKSISSSTLDINIGEVNLSSNTNIPIVLTDSRGNSTSIDMPITVLPYQLPSAIINLKRQQNYYTETDITPDATYSSLDGNNTLTIQYRKKKTSDASYDSYSTIANNTTTTFNADNLYSWNIQVLLTDRIGSATYNLTLSVGTPIFFIDRQKYSIGLNCFPKQNNSIEINGKTLLDLIYPVGSIYFSDNATNPNTLFGGTWERLGGRYLYANASGSMTQSQSTGLTTESHTLTINEIPSHTHGIPIGNYVNTDSQTSTPSAGHVADSPQGVNYTTGGTGGGQGHTHDIPYIGLCVWRRTA